MVDLGDITWPQPPLMASVLACALLFFFFKLQSSESTARSNDFQVMTTNGHDKGRGAVPAIKPRDGSVKVSQILIHPIKSCRGTSVQEANYTPEGLEHDRKFSIIDAKTNTVLTIRQISKMVLINPKIDGDNLVVSFPSGSGCRSFTVPLEPMPETLASWKLIKSLSLHHHTVDGYIVESSAGSLLPPTAPSDTLSAYFGKPVHLVYKGPARRAVDTTYEFPVLDASSVYQDMYPLLVLGEEGVSDVERETRKRIGEHGIEDHWREEKIQLRRFRPNIVVSGAGAWAEDEWEEIRIGHLLAPKITLVSRCTRCMLPNVSPDTGECDKAVPYKVISKYRTRKDPMREIKPCVGSNAVPEMSGKARVGDVVYVTKMLGEGEARVPFQGEKKEEVT